MHDLEDVFERPTFNQTALKILLDNLILVRENTTRAVSSLETILYLIKTPQQHSLKQILAVSLPLDNGYALAVCYAMMYEMINEFAFIHFSRPKYSK